MTHEIHAVDPHEPEPTHEPGEPSPEIENPPLPRPGVPVPEIGNPHITRPEVSPQPAPGQPVPISPAGPWIETA